MRAAGAAAALLVATVAGGPAPGPSTEVVTRHFTARDQQLGRYQYVPFDVAAGTTRLTIAYRYDRAGGHNVVDLGVFEPGPTAIGSTALRGWSGGARDTVTIGVDAATPGYWPGPLPAGRWHVAFGLYKVSAAGVDVEVTVQASAETPKSATPGVAPRPDEPIRSGPSWFAGALHTHTVHSDGALTPQQLADKARAEGLHFLAITDHNNTTHQLDAVNAPGLLVIPGEEVTTPGGHFNAWGLRGARDYVDFRLLAGDPALGGIMRAVRARGGLIGINHPIDDCLACSWTHPFPGEASAIEIANGDADQRRQAMAIWDHLLRQGRRITAVGESDWHRGEAPLGTASVRVRADELSTPAILNAIAAGRVVVMADGATPPPALVVRTGAVEAHIGDTLRVRSGERFQIDVRGEGERYRGARLKLFWNGEPVAAAEASAAGQAGFERYAVAPGYLRVHVLTAEGAPLAITNPVFVEVLPR